MLRFLELDFLDIPTALAAAHLRTSHRERAGDVSLVPMAAPALSRLPPRLPLRKATGSVFANHVTGTAMLDRLLHCAVPPNIRDNIA